MNTPKPIHIFRPGRHVALNGDVVEFSEADCAAIARSYNPKLHEAPLVVGHPKTDDPALGWVQSLTANARGVFAVPRNVDPAFAESVGQRRYGKVSAKFYRPDSPANPVPGSYYLRHVGFLGALPPGVKGLDDPAFAEGDEDCVAFHEPLEFGDWDDQNIAAMFRSLRDWLLAKFGKEAADQALPSYNVDSLQESAAQPESVEDAPQPAFGEGKAQAVASTADSQKEKEAVTPEEKARLEAENDQLKKQLAQQQAKEQQAEDAKRHGDNLTFAEGLVNQGVLPPKHQDAVVALLDLVGAPDSDGKSVEFGEGDDKQPLVEAVKGFLGDMPKFVEFGEHATKGRAAPKTNINPLLADAERRAAAAK